MIKAQVKGDGKHKHIKATITGEDTLEEVIVMLGAMTESVNNAITKEIKDEKAMVHARGALLHAVLKLAKTIREQMLREIREYGLTEYINSLKPEEITQMEESMAGADPETERKNAEAEDALARKIWESIQPGSKQDEE